MYQQLKNYYGKGDIYINMEGEMVTLLEDMEPSYYKKLIYIYSREKCMFCISQEVSVRQYRSITPLLEKYLSGVDTFVDAP